MLKQKTRKILKIEVEIFDEIYGYRIIGWDNSFMSKEELIKLLEERILR